MKRLVGLFAATVLLLLSPVRAQDITLELAKKRVGAVVPEVERIRGLAFRRQVPVEVIDDAGAREHMLARVDEFDMRDQIATAQEAWRLLGLIGPDEDVLELFLAAIDEQAGGFYDPGDKHFFLLDDMPAATIEILTAHELTHALEDQYFDLDRRIEEVIDDDDRSFAAASLHEGSAMLVMSVYAAKAILSGEIDQDALGTFEDEMSQGKALEALPPVLLRQLMGPYLLGAGFLVRGDMTSLMTRGFPVADVNQAYADPPVSSEQILHPEKYWDRRDDPRPIDLDGAGAALGHRYRRVGAGVLGEVVLALMTGATTSTEPTDLLMQGGEAWTNEAAEGWDGDRWELWRKGDATAVLMLTVWDSDEDARQFERALDGPASLRTAREGDRVAIVAGDLGKRASRVLRALLEPSRVGVVE